MSLAIATIVTRSRLAPPKARVTVIIPTYNRRSMLLRAVSSVSAQEGVDTQVIVVDNGSTDGSADAVGTQYGPRVTVRTVDRRHEPGSARNAGVELATGDWIAFLDDDDVWAPTKLLKQVQAAEHTGAEWVYAGGVTVDSDLRIIGAARPDPPDVIRASLPVRNRLQAGPSNVLVRPDLLRRAGTFDTELRYHQDWDLWIRLASLTRPAMANHPLVGYVVHGGNMPMEGMVAEADIIAERYAELRRGRTLDRAAMYRYLAGHYARAGQRREALRAYTAALREDPGASALKGAAVLLNLRVGPRTTFRKPGDQAWRAEAEAWLRQLRAEWVAARHSMSASAVAG